MILSHPAPQAVTEDDGDAAGCAGAAGAPAARATRRTTSDALLGDARELIIDHGGEAYRLRRTGKGKLILIK